MSRLLHHRGRVFAVLLVSNALLLSACASRDQQADADKFYTYIDATGTPVVIARPSANDEDPMQNADAGKAAAQEGKGSKPVSAATETAAEAVAGTENEATNETAAGIGSAPAEGDDRLPPLAQTPDELWAFPDEQYLAVEEIEALISAQDRDRFITYVDETGQRRTEALDLAAVRSTEDVAPEGEEGGEALFPAGESDGPAIITEGWLEIPADCCQQAIERAAEVADTGEAPLRFSGQHLALIQLDGGRPALALPIPSGTDALRLQSWQARGYLLPQLIFLDSAGMPLVHVAMPFSRYFAETWRSKARLEGRVPVEPGAQWVLFFLDYARIEGRTLVQRADTIRLGDQQFGLALVGEAVVGFERDER